MTGPEDQVSVALWWDSDGAAPTPFLPSHLFSVWIALQETDSAQSLTVQEGLCWDEEGSGTHPKQSDELQEPEAAGEHMVDTWKDDTEVTIKTRKQDLEWSCFYGTSQGHGASFASFSPFTASNGISILQIISLQIIFLLFCFYVSPGCKIHFPE